MTAKKYLSNVWATVRAAPCAMTDLLASLFSVNLALAVLATQARETHSAGTLGLLMTVPITLALGFVLMRIAPALTSTSPGDEVLALRKLAFCLRPLYVSWTSIFGLSITGLGSVRGVLFLAMLLGVAFLLSLQKRGAFVDLVGARDTWARYQVSSSSAQRLVRWVPALVLVPLTVMLFAAYSSRYQRIADFDNGCEFGGDVWEYQSMAVNYAKGHGYPIFGGIEPFETYSFGRDQDKTQPEILKRFREKNTGEFNFYRTPAYSFFLGVFYKVEGISPLKFKRLQLQLYCAVAALLPFVAFMYWRWHGVLAGVIAGGIFLERYHGLSGLIMLENGSTFCMMLLVLAYLFWERRTGFISAVVLGVVLGFSLLVKGAFIFMLPLFAVTFGVRCFQGKLAIRHAVAVFAACALTVAPWSIYATAKHGSLVVLSTQGKSDILLQMNNEASVKSGTWESTGHKKPESFFQRPDVAKHSYSQQVLLFYASNPSAILEMARNKVELAFKTFDFYRIGMLLIIFRLTTVLFLGPCLRRRHGADAGVTARPVELVFWLLGLSFVAPMLTGKTVLMALATDNYLLLVLCGILALLALLMRPIGKVEVPLIFILLFLNYLCVTIAFFGYMRYLWPMAFIFVLVGVRFIIFYLWQALRFINSAFRVHAADSSVAGA